jgi:hypothetical protein
MNKNLKTNQQKFKFLNNRSSVDSAITPQILKLINASNKLESSRNNLNKNE